MNTRLTVAVIGALLALTACTTTHQPTATHTVTIPAPTPSEPTPTPTFDDDMTQLVVDISWSQQTETDKDAMCLGLTLQGTDWAANQMRAGAGDESVDWERAAELVEAKCEQR